MVELKVSGVVGPLPSDGSCLMILAGGGKTISVRGGPIDAGVCSYYISGRKTSTPFRFLIDTLTAVDVKIEKVSIDISSEGTLARIYMKGKNRKKPLCITTSDLCSAINVAMSVQKKIVMSKSSFDSVTDRTGQYAIISSELDSLWPLTKISKTELLQAMTEIIDSSIGSHAAT